MMGAWRVVEGLTPRIALLPGDHVASVTDYKQAQAAIRYDTTVHEQHLQSTSATDMSQASTAV